MNCPYMIKVCTKCKRILVACEINYRKRKDGKYGFRAECRHCQEKYEKQYREINKDEISKKDRIRHARNKEERNKKQREYNKKHKEEIKDYNKKYYEENKEKIKKDNTKYREKNKDKVSEYNKEYYSRNKEKLSKYRKEYYEENKERLAEHNRMYRKENPDICFNNDARKRERKENQGSGITKEQWLEMMEFFNWKCAYSNKVLSKDTRTIDHIIPLSEGGEHEVWNCVPMLRSLNSSKYTKEMNDWYLEQEFFDINNLLRIYEWIEYAYNKWNINKEV